MWSVWKQIGQAYSKVGQELGLRCVQCGIKLVKLTLFFLENSSAGQQSTGPLMQSRSSLRNLFLLAFPQV